MSYAGEQMQCPNPDCAEPILARPFEDRPELCEHCGTEVDWRDWNHNAEPIHMDELDGYDRA